MFFVSGYETGLFLVKASMGYETGVWNRYETGNAKLDEEHGYETGMKPTSHKLFVYLLCQPTKQWQLHWMAEARRGIKPVWNWVWNRYETNIKPPHHPNYLFLCRHSLQRYGSCIGWQWRDAVWNLYETGMTPGMKPVWNQYETAASPKLFVSLSSQPTKRWQLHLMAMARRGMKPIWNLVWNQYETIMKPASPAWRSGPINTNYWIFKYTYAFLSTLWLFDVHSVIENETKLASAGSEQILVDLLSNSKWKWKEVGLGWLKADSGWFATKF